MRGEGGAIGENSKLNSDFFTRSYEILVLVVCFIFQKKKKIKDSGCKTSKFDFAPPIICQNKNLKQFFSEF